MSRGDRREDIFLDDVDRQDFLKTLAEVCLKTDWQIHAYCLMRNHYHLVLETPKANLVAGMAWRQSTYAIRLGHSHKLFGHKGGPLKLALAARLRKETTLSLKTIAARVHLGTSKGANSNLHKWMQARASENPTPSHS